MTALARAQAQVAAVRDDPLARLALMGRVFHGPTGHAPRHLPFRRAALSFMRWQARRGVLDPLDASPPGSVWWRAVNEGLLRDGCETVALLGGLDGEASSQAVRLWLEFGARPTGRNWYRAHNASIVRAYLEHRELAEAESPSERFFMNVVLVRVLYAHALNAAPRLALGRLAPIGRAVGDPRLGMAGVFLSLQRVLPDRYPLTLDVERYIADEQRLGRMLDYAVIVPRLQPLYEWSAEELSEPRLLDLVRDGNPTYAWPFEERGVWRSPRLPLAARVLERAIGEDAPMAALTDARPPKLRSRPRQRTLAAAPPEEVADGVWLLRGGLLRTMNVYLVRDDERGGVLVFDAGEKGMAASIVAAALPHGGISRVVLGHGDTDHRGAAPALRAYADVLCHPDAVEQAQGSGGRDYWRPDALPLDVRLLHGFAHRFIWDGGPVPVDGTVREGDRLAGFEVVDLSGHAPGLIGLWRERDRVALVSDCFYMTDMHGRPQPPSLPLDVYNLDTAQARRSIQKLAELGPAIACPGHLGPLTGTDVVTQLEAAAAT